MKRQFTQKMAINERLLIFAVALSMANCQDCTTASLGVCEGSFAGSDILALNVSLGTILPAWGETYQQLLDRCGRFQRYSVCMENVIPFCNATYGAYLNGLDYAYNFLCNDVNNGLQDVAQYEQCYEESSVIQGANFCFKTYETKLETLSGNSQPSATANAFCIYTDGFLTCMKSTVSSSCSSSAAAWILEWNRRLLYFVVVGSNFYCPGWSNSSSNNSSTTVWTIVLSVVLGLTTIILIMGLIIAFIVINRKKKLQHRRATLTRPPPPYSTEPYTACDRQEPESTDGAVSLPLPAHPDGAIAVTMQPVAPPPYAGKTAPEYGLINEGIPNSGYDDDTDTMNSRLENHEEKELGVSTNSGPRFTDANSDARNFASGEFF